MKSLSIKIVLSMSFLCACISGMAQEYRCTQAEKAVFDKYSEMILMRTSYRAAEELMRLELTYSVPAEKRSLIKHFVDNREFHKVCIEILCDDSLKKRVQWKMNIDAAYQDSIDKVLIPVYVNKISGDNISFALYCKKGLHLDNAQYEYLLSKALDMAHKIKRNRTVNLWNEEMDALKKTLTKKQLNVFFQNKNAVKVTQEAKDAWNKICEYGLAEQVDSAKQMNLAISYFNERLKIKDLYRYYGTAQKKYLAELDRQKPLIVKMLDAIDKNKRLKEQKQDNIGKEFVW